MKRKIFRFFLKTVIIIFLITTICTINGLYNKSYATIGLDNFTGGDSTGSEGISDALGEAIGVVQVVAVGVAIIMLVVVGIKYLVSSVSERAEIKKHLVVYVSGAMLIFGASGIVTMIRTFAGEMGGN